MTPVMLMSLKGKMLMWNKLAGSVQHTSILMHLQSAGTIEFVSENWRSYLEIVIICTTELRIMFFEITIYCLFC